MSIRSEELSITIAKLKALIKADAKKIADDPEPDAKALTNFKNQLVHTLRRLNRYEKELEMLQ